MAYVDLQFFQEKGIVRKTERFSQYDFDRYITLLSRAKENQDPLVVQVFDFEIPTEEEVKKLDRHSLPMINFYVRHDMELCFKLSQEERDVVNAARRSSLYSKHWQETCEVNVFPELTIFLTKVLNGECSLGRYCDLHNGNVMKDQLGNYKLIDLESFIY